MRKILLTVLSLALFSASISEAAVLQLSTSATDPDAGSSLSLNINDSGSMFVWVAADDGQTIRGMSIDILSSDVAVLEATDHIVDGSRWQAAGVGDLGDLVDNSNSVAITSGTGIVGNTLVLHSEVQFIATAAGTTDLQLARGFEGFVDGAFADIPDTEITYGGGTVNVAVPEPSSIGLIGLGAIAGVLRRRRRA
ncbi:MAG: PEP-CTERM sorting domain-containing protein [Pirellulaceae bacterium]